MTYGDGGQWPKGYGPEVKRVAREIKDGGGVGTLDLPRDWDERKRVLNRVAGYRKSLSKIFEHPIDSTIEKDDFDNGAEFVAFFRREA